MSSYLLVLILKENNIMENIKLFNMLERLGATGWRSALEGTRRLMGIFTKSLLVIFGRLSTGHCLAVYSMSREIIRIYRKSGPLFLGLYLKQVAFATQQYTGGEGKPVCTKTYISLTRTGIPTFIPSHYRKMMRNGDLLCVRVVLSVCALHRIIRVPRKNSRNKVDPSTIHMLDFKVEPPLQELLDFIQSVAWGFICHYVPAPVLPLNLGFRVRPSFTSGPNTYKKVDETNLCVTGAERKIRLSQYHTFPLDALALIQGFSPERLMFWFSVWSAHRIEFCSMEDTVPVYKEGVKPFSMLMANLAHTAEHVWTKLKTNAEVGRFGLKIEPAGKVRVFAIGNPILQNLIRPLHDWVMDLLKSLPTDGTYNQLAPLRRLKGHMILYSYDLKSATDLLPAVISRDMLFALFGREVAESWYEIMSMTCFRSPERLQTAGRGKRHRFTRGQPLGFYSSWPVFTLTHHLIVWLAAYRVYPGKKFLDYAILGDDIVIADRKVALEYRKIMGEAQAVISLEKTLVSSSGACEFAKRFLVRAGSVDLSPVSVACIRLASGFTPPGLFLQLGVRDLRTTIRLKGGGYRVYNSTSFKKLSRRWRRHLLSMYSPSGIFPLPLELWLAWPFGVLTCYQLGAVREYILKRIQPKDLNEASFDYACRYWKDNEEGFEWTIQSLVSAHCRYIAWYAKVSSDFSVPLADIIHPPLASRKIEREVNDDGQAVRRYGIVFAAWDFIRCWIPCKILTPTNHMVTWIGCPKGYSNNQ
nr:MAG: putative RNA-dependent RNA polymerase [Mitoviridae sp.]